ncbi:MAG: orotidine-5'-phosphate decarboxylase [Lachnospiraceae bacterium]|nr:orotidine-5'-phosphate decarboxylase [Lachnospiraceae bacterium]
MIDKLIEKIQKTGAPIVVGLDPMMKFVPDHIKKTAFAQKGETLEGAAEAVWLYNKEIIDKTYDLIPAVKPQIAMYEQFGIPGLVAFQRTVKYCKEKGLVVIGDIKRGDIGSTSAAYAAAHLGKVQVGSSLCAGFDEDFVTVNPYLGSDGVQPFIDVCREETKGIFVLVKTSNPSSGEFQDQMVSTGNTTGNAGGITFSEQALYEIVGMKVAQWGEQLMGKKGYSSVGAVVGATYPEQGKVLRKVMPHAFILVPGYGAQGASGKDLIHFFDENRLGAIINSSRGIIAAYQNEKYRSFGAENFADASRQAVLDMIADIDQAFAGADR